MILLERELRNYLGLYESNQSNLVFSRVVVDSRIVLPGDLFVAIKSQKNDGHDFVLDAVKRGALGVVVENTWQGSKSLSSSVKIFNVPNTVDTLQKIAKLWRLKYPGIVVAIAGSAGKTTTKDLLASILSSKFKVQKTIASQNGEFGIPLTLLAINKFTDVVVIEVGIDRIGAMSRLENIILPDMAIVTSISEEHLTGLISIENVINEETLILKRVLARNGKVFIGVDDSNLRKFALNHYTENLFTYSLSNLNNFKASLRASYDLNSTTINFNEPSFNHSITCPLPGIHNASNLMGAVQIAFQLGCSFEEIENGLSTFCPAQDRSNIQKLEKLGIVLLDYYNANPSSMRAAIDLVF